MNEAELDFSTLLSVDPLQWGKDIDPLGLMAYRNYKRRALGEAVELTEVLDAQQRTRRKLLMKRLAPHLKSARKLALKTRAGTDVLKRRARSLAISTLSRKLLGGRNKADVSQSERARVEKILAKRKGSIDKLANKLVSVVRQKQAKRFAVKKVVPHAVKKAKPGPVVPKKKHVAPKPVAPVKPKPHESPKPVQVIKPAAANK